MFGRAKLNSDSVDKDNGKNEHQHEVDETGELGERFLNLSSVGDFFGEPDPANSNSVYPFTAVADASHHLQAELLLNKESVEANNKATLLAKNQQVRDENRPRVIAIPARVCDMYLKSSKRRGDGPRVYRIWHRAVLLKSSHLLTPSGSCRCLVIPSSVFSAVVGYVPILAVGASLDYLVDRVKKHSQWCDTQLHLLKKSPNLSAHRANGEKVRMGEERGDGHEQLLFWDSLCSAPELEVTYIFAHRFAPR